MLVGGMVGNEIENEAHISRCESIAQALKRLVAPEFGIERTVLDHVVSVRATSAGLEKRRGIEVADADSLQVRDEFGCVVKSESRSKLEPIRCNRNRGRHHPSPIVQDMDQGASGCSGSTPQLDPRLKSRRSATSNRAPAVMSPPKTPESIAAVPPTSSQT